MKCFPLDLRHLQRDSGFSAGFGEDGEPAYTLTSALTGGQHSCRGAGVGGRR